MLLLLTNKTVKLYKMKKFNLLKIIKIVLAVLSAGKTIHDEIKSTKKEGLDNGLEPPVDNTDPQNPNVPPRK